MTITRFTTVEEVRKFKLNISEKYVQRFNECGRKGDPEWEEISYQEFYNIYCDNGQSTEKGKRFTPNHWGCSVATFLRDYVECDLCESFVQMESSEVKEVEDEVEP